MDDTVEAVWDPEACVWVAGSEDVPGLVAEAATIEGLVDVVDDLIPDLLAANGTCVRATRPT
ncbi:MAG: DUF1902 domain-containing protein [Alphaproteobacteria bacterium]|nr:DUF1902 domain-containing protein [Alphaproteobacteria bacterium]